MVTGTFPGEINNMKKNFNFNGLNVQTDERFFLDNISGC